MKYSVCVDSVFVNGTSFIEAMKRTRECGYSSIEFWSWWDKDIKKIITAKDELGLEIATFCTKFANPGDVSLQEEYVNGLKDTIKVAKQLSCNTIITQAGYETKEISFQEHRKNLLRVLKIAAPIVEAEGITLVVEPLNLLVDHPGYHLSTSKDAFELIDQVNSTNIKVLFDIYHQQITEGNLIHNITSNIAKIGHFHAASNPGRGKITDGEIDYKNVLTAIYKSDYQGYIGLEFMTKNDPENELIEIKSKLLDRIAQ